MAPRRLRRYIHTWLEGRYEFTFGASNAIDDGIRSISRQASFSAAANLRLPRQKARLATVILHTDMDMHPAARVLSYGFAIKVACILCFSAIRRTGVLVPAHHRKLPARYRYGKDDFKLTWRGLSDRAICRNQLYCASSSISLSTSAKWLRLSTSKPGFVYCGHRCRARRAVAEPFSVALAIQ